MVSGWSNKYKKLTTVTCLHGWLHGHIKSKPMQMPVVPVYRLSRICREIYFCCRLPIPVARIAAIKSSPSAENVKNTVTTSPESTANVGDTVTLPAKEVVIQNTNEEKSSSPLALNPLKTKMEKLETLLTDGIITEEEFSKKKQQMIDEYLIV